MSVTTFHFTDISNSLWLILKNKKVPNKQFYRVIKLETYANFPYIGTPVMPNVARDMSLLLG